MAAITARSCRAFHALAILGSGACSNRQEVLTFGRHLHGSRHNKSLQLSPKTTLGKQGISAETELSLWGSGRRGN